VIVADGVWYWYTGAKRPYCIPSLRGVAHLPPLPKLDDLPDGLVEKVRDLPLELVRTPNSTSTLLPPLRSS
jgi:hypothetical protein